MNRSRLSMTLRVTVNDKLESDSDWVRGSAHVKDGSLSEFVYSYTSSMATIHAGIGDEHSYRRARAIRAVVDHAIRFRELAEAGEVAL